MTAYIRCVQVLFITVACGVSLGVLAAGDPQPDQIGPATLKQLSLKELSEIEVVTPSKEPQKASRTPMAIYVITGDDIQRSGATSIPEALRLAPGVEVARIDSDKWSIGIRGFGTRLSRSVLVLIDGRSVYTPLFAGTYWEVQDTMLADVDRIEVIRGPGGTIWGPNAVNGIINVITKSAKDTQGLLASAGGGNLEQGFVNFRYGGGKDNLHYRFYGKGFTRAPEQHSDGRNYDDWRSAQTGFRIDWDRSSKDTFTLQGDVYQELAGERVTATSYSAPYSRNVDANADLSGGNLEARWHRTVNENNDLQLQIYWDRTNRHEPNLGEIRDSYDIDFLQRLRAPGRQQISWGFGARVSPRHILPVVAGLVFNPARDSDYLLSGFIQDQIDIVPERLSLILGAKFLRTNFTPFAPQPSVRLLWTPSGRNTFWAAFTHSVRTPSDSERQFTLLGLEQVTSSGVPFFARFDPNRQFAPEQLNGYEAGYRRLIGKAVYLDLATFFNHYHDLFDIEVNGAAFIETDPAPTHILLPAGFHNGILGTTQGFEIAPEWRPTESVRLRGSYSYLNLDLAKAPGSGDIGTIHGTEGSSPKHQILAQADFDVTKSLQAGFTYRYVSKLWGQGVPSYSTGDARIAWRFRPDLELSVVGRNLFQPSHVEYISDPAEYIGIKRSAYLQLTWIR